MNVWTPKIGAQRWRQGIEDLRRKDEFTNWVDIEVRVAWKVTLGRRQAKRSVLETSSTSHIKLPCWQFSLREYSIYFVSRVNFSLRGIHGWGKPWKSCQGVGNSVGTTLGTTNRGWTVLYQSCSSCWTATSIFLILKILSSESSNIRWLSCTEGWRRLPSGPGWLSKPPWLLYRLSL